METLVFGHRNPDTDSIAAALGYAWLAGETRPEAGPFVACRLGELNAESAWVLGRFGVDAPRLVTHVRMTARQAMKTQVLTATPDTPMHELGRTMVGRDIRAVPVLEGGRVAGIVSERDLARRYLAESEIEGFAEAPTTVAALAESLGAERIAGEPDASVSGRVLIGAMEPDTMRGYIGPGDVVIIGDRIRGQLAAVECGAACLILTGGARPTDEVSKAAARRGTSILATPDDTYGAARRVNLAVPARAVMDPDPLVVGPEDLLADIRADLVGSPHREALVCDPSGALVGLVSRTDVARAGRQPVVLVDHSESAQSADGLGEARVLAVVDHHRLGDVESAEPIDVLTRPVGSTSTMVAELAREAGVELPGALAGILLAAVLSDTLILRSPTTADLDRDVAAWLGVRAGLDPEAFGLEMFRARAADGGPGAEAAVRTDLKIFTFSGHRVGIAQVETVDGERFLGDREALLAALDRLIEDRELEIAVLMVTDVLREGSVLLSRGRTRAVERAFGLEDEPERLLPGVLSRKKQVASVLARALGGA